MIPRPRATGASAARWRVAGEELLVRTPDAASRDRFAALLDDLVLAAPLPPRGGGGGEPLRVDLLEPPPLPSTPDGADEAEEGELVHATERLSILRRGDRFELRCGDAALRADPARGRAEGGIGPGFWGEERFDQREWLLLSLLILLHPRGGFGVHANALAAPGRAAAGSGVAPGVLIAGRSGAGKTTLTLALRRAGWTVLSDDATVLRAAADGRAVAHPLRRGFSCAPRTLAAFPELSRARELYRVEGKRVLDLEGLEPAPAPPAPCAPRALLLPRVADEDATSVRRVPAAEALMELGRQSAGLRTGAAAARAQFALLGRLALDAPAWRVELGRDLLADPGGAATRVAAAAFDGAGAAPGPA